MNSGEIPVLPLVNGSGEGPARSAPEPLSIAIVVPTYNRPEKLRLCLASLAKLQGGPYRTIIVDDGGREPLDAICAPYRDWVELVRKENGGPAGARNIGVRMAEGSELIALLDDDCHPHPDWILQLIEAQAGTPGRLVGGRVDNGLPGNVYSSASQTLCTYLYEYYDSQDSEMGFFTGNNMCCRREDYLALGGFDETFPLAGGEDRDFGIRWTRAGGELVYAPRAAIDHEHDLTIQRFWRQHANYGRGARRLHLTMDERGDDRSKLERASFYLGLLTFPLRNRVKRPFAEMALMGLSQVATAAGYAQALIDERRARPSA